MSKLYELAAQIAPPFLDQFPLQTRSIPVKVLQVLKLIAPPFKAIIFSDISISEKSILLDPLKYIVPLPLFAELYLKRLF